eukprot:12917112-Prorocentrum_lima.AAC.1
MAVGGARCGYAHSAPRHAIGLFGGQFPGKGSRSGHSLWEWSEQHEGWGRRGRTPKKKKGALLVTMHL